MAMRVCWVSDRLTKTGYLWYVMQFLELWLFKVLKWMLKSPTLSTLPEKASQYSRNSRNWLKTTTTKNNNNVSLVWCWAVNAKEIVSFVVNGGEWAVLLQSRSGERENDAEKETFCFNDSLTMQAISPPLQLQHLVSEERSRLNTLGERDQHI